MMMFNKKLIASAVTSVALAGMGFVTTQVAPQAATQEVHADAWVNDYISKNNIKPVGIENREGTFNQWFGYENGVGKPEGVLIHETATPNATAENEVSYFNNHWKKLSTYVHAFIDGNKIINIKNTNYGVWGAGYTANQKYIQVELCNVNTADQFARSISNDAYYTAAKLIQYNLPFVPNKTVVTHKQAASWWHDTNHTDPDGYLARWGYDMNQFNDLVGKYYNNLKDHGTTDDQNGQTTQPSTPDPNKHVGSVNVNNPDSFASPLVSFNGDTMKDVVNRGLGNNTPWYTDQQKQHDGHTYYRVSTNEWVSDQYATFTAE